MASGRPSTGAQATGQGIRPQYSQRAFAVGFGSGEVDSSLRDVDLFTRSAPLSDVDLSFPTNGPGLTISRSYNGAQLNAGPAYSRDGYHGHNWFQGARPELVRGTAASSNDMLYLVVGGKPSDGVPAGGIVDDAVLGRERDAGGRQDRRRETSTSIRPTDCRPPAFAPPKAGVEYLNTACAAGSGLLLGSHGPVDGPTTPYLRSISR